ncbi:MAG: GH25 family lysozyme [Carnobacterium sp.]|nr:GH25 family lysozyme [Carnobacterium sp.]
MKHTKKFTVATATLLLLTIQSVLAETAQETITTDTTAEVQLSENSSNEARLTNSVIPIAEQEVSKEPEKTTETTQQTRSRSKREALNQIDEYYQQQHYTGFATQNGDTYYYLEGTKLTSQWKYIHNQYYYFNENGQMQTNTLIDGYVMDEDGIMARNRFVTINGNRYFADEHGKAFNSNWKKIDGKWYSFKDNGVLRQNEFYDYYYLKADGAMADNEWIFDKYYNSYFFMKPGGAYASREWKDSYYLKAGGYMAKSEFVYDDHYKATYYFEESGRYVGGKWIEVNGKKYHFQMDGVLETNKWLGNYYVKSDGAMAKNEWFFDKNYGSYFYLGDDGKYIGGNRWYQVDGDWYYFIADGQMATRKWIDSYYVKEDGRMAKNEMQYDQSSGSSYYFKEDGTVAKNYWAKVGDYWYYFKSNGKVARKEWIDNKYYVLDNGKMATGTHIIDHYQYVFDESGNVLSKKAVDIGWVEKNGKRYFYNGASQRLGDETAKKVMDVSEHQGYIANWEALIKDNGIDAVIVRIGYSGTEDKYLAHNISELNRLGVPYGIYLYTYASTEEDGRDDAEQTLALIKKYNIKPTYPIYFDIEDWRYRNGTKSAPTDTATWVKIWKAYRDTMEKAGYTNVRVYSYQYLLQNRLNDPEILKYVDWVAAYTPQLRYQLPYSQPSWGWQYTDKEFILGLGNVDMSVWFGR